MPNIYEQPDWDDIHTRAKERMAQVDAMPPKVRSLIHEFNVNAVVEAFNMGYHTVAEIQHALRSRRQ